jgi:hypothetical protein
LLWTFNPLLLQVLVAGEHVDSQAIFFGVAAMALVSLRMPNDPSQASAARGFLVAALAGGLVGLGTAVKLTMVLVVAGLAVAAVAAWWRRWRWLAVAGGGLTTGFAVIVAASLVPWGFTTLRPALHAGSFVSIGSPWRLVRLGLHVLVSEGIANDLVKVGAIVLAGLLVVMLLRALGVLGAGNEGTRLGGAWDTGQDVNVGLLAACGVFAFAFAWLVAWPYVLPWYDGLGWAALALLPIPSRPIPSLVVPALDWLLLTRTAALAFGYLPARGITMPADLHWLQSVVRTGVTPVILLAVTVALVMLLRPRGMRAPA